MNSADQEPFFQFSVRWLFAIVALAAVWIVFLIHGPQGSAILVGTFLASATLLIYGYQRPRNDARRGCIFAVAMFLMLLAHICMLFVLVSRYLF